MNKSFIAVAVGLGAVLSVSAWLLSHRSTVTADDFSNVELAPIEINHTGMQIIRADLAETDGILQRAVAMRDDAGLTVHTRKAVRLPMPKIDTERFDDYEIMRDAARRDADRFIERYTHNNGLIPTR